MGQAYLWQKYYNIIFLILPKKKDLSGGKISLDCRFIT
jgi:hypothetical protein